MICVILLVLAIGSSLGDSLLYVFASCCFDGGGGGDTNTVSVWF